MGITSTGIGSNLDVESIVTQLMNVEKRPLTLIAQKEASYQAKLTGFGTLKGALSQFQTAVQGLADISKFRKISASVSDEDVATVSAGTSASTGKFALEISQLAKAQKLVASGQASDTAKIGTGVITIDFGTITGGAFDSSTGKYAGATFTSNGTGVKTVKIDTNDSTLAGIRDAINKADVGVTASIVNDGGTTPYRLVISANNSGKANSVKISVADANGDTGLSALLNHDPSASQALSQTVTAQNAEFKVDGIAISKASNTVTDAISGVTLNLLKESGKANVSVTRDTASVSSAIDSFVKTYNDIMQTLKAASAYDKETKTAAILNGESAVRIIQTQLRAVLNTPIAGGAGAFNNLSQIGVTFQKDGTLAVDSAKLQKALDGNFNDIATLFAAGGKASDGLVNFVSSSAKTQPGSYPVVVTQLATQGKTVGGAALGSTTITKGVNDTLEVHLDGTSAIITLSEGNYADGAALAAEIQSKINGVSDFSKAGSSVKVSEAGGVLSITSDRYGSASKIKISGGNGVANLGFSIVDSPTVTDGLDVAGTINGRAASGSGQILTGGTGDASEGLKIKVTGGSIGSRGTVGYSQGYADMLVKATETLLDDDGPITSSTDSINDSIESLTKDKERINLRLTALEKQYRAQFTALDVLLSKMSSTSNFLSQQISSLSSSSSSN